MPQPDASLTTVAAANITGTTLPTAIVTSSLTTVGALMAGAVPASLVTAGTFGAGAYTFPGALTVSGLLTAGAGLMVDGGTVDFPFLPGATYLGYQAGLGAPGSSTYNTLVGYQAGAALTGDATTGAHNNTFVGFQVGAVATSAFGNTGVGLQNLLALTTGAYNTTLGIHAGTAISSGGANTVLGTGCMETLATGASNTAIGTYAGKYSVSGSGNVFLGAYAGAYELGSNAFYVDNQDRTNTAGDKANALLYGVFAATPAGQTLAINAQTTIAGQYGFTATYGLNEVLTNGVAEIAINQLGYQFGLSQFRNFTVYDGKNGVAFQIVGASKSAQFIGLLTASAGLTIASGQDLTLGRAYSAGVVTATGTIALKDSTGTVYNVLVHT